LLIARRREETLTPSEQQELIQFSDRLEALNVARVEKLAELARVRGMTLPDLMQSLGQEQTIDG
jgi:hypothetical protein